MADTSDYWRERWQENQIRFHKEAVNQTLCNFSIK
jgi:hypothetical protein